MSPSVRSMASRVVRSDPELRSGRMRVMLVDDHALVRSAVRQAIEGPDIVVVAEAEGFAEALQSAERSRPDVVLVDIGLGPSGDGLQLVGELSPRLPNTTFIMLSASGSDADLLEAVMAGARGYLTKNVSPEALLRAVRSARAGELVMPRAMAARLVQRLADAARNPGGLDGPEFVRLSSREREVLRLLANGRTDREIAQALTISPRTAETHVAAILRKLEVRNRSEAAMLYRHSRSSRTVGARLDDATV
jgi:DNA-binding NarL/FixJ family response regulator